MRVISQATIRPHVLDLPAFADAAKFRPFAAQILDWASVAENEPARARARAVIGWFAAHAVHPQEFLHPDGTSLNTQVLPSGKTWADFNDTFNVEPRLTTDKSYWFALFPNGITMLERLIGTTASNGTITDDGMLTKSAPGVWEIRDFTGFRAAQCTFQCKMAQVVLAAIGIPSFDITTAGHDPMAYYDIEEGRWLYIDPTFGEMLSIGANSATPLDLLTTCLAGDDDLIVSDKLPGADYIPVGYFTSPALPSGGMTFMTIHTAPQWAGGLSDRAPYRFGALPSLSTANDRVGIVEQLMPVLGVGVAGLIRNGETVEVRLRSNWLKHAAYARSLDDGGSWQACTEIDYPPTAVEGIRYRSQDSDGLAGREAVIDT